MTVGSKLMVQSGQSVLEESPQSLATTSSSQSNPSSQDVNCILSEFDSHHQSLLRKGSSTTKTWGAEVRCYLNKLEEDVTKIQT